MLTRKKVIGISAAAVVVVMALGVGISRPSKPAAAVHAPGQPVIDESEMSPAAFKERRRQLVEKNRAKGAERGGGLGTPADRRRAG